MKLTDAQISLLNRQIKRGLIKELYTSGKISNNEFQRLMSIKETL